MLISLRETYFKAIAEGKTDEEALYIVETKVFKNGVLATKVLAITGRSVASATILQAGGAMFSPLAWGFASMVLVAETIANHRRLYAGKITKQEFNQRLKFNSAKAGGGILGSSGGAAAGFLIGSALFPGIGSLIGTFVGAVAGGVMGAKLSLKMVTKLDDRMQQTKLIRQKIKEELEQRRIEERKSF